MPTLRSVLAMSCLCSLVFGNARAADPAFVAGPFTIEAGKARISAGGFPNTSGNPFARKTVSSYRVRHHGKPVSVGEADARLDKFWDARSIAGAPRPAVLVATTGLWLLTDVDGALDVKTLVAPSTDIVRWQWLDGPDGKPGEEQNVTIRDSSVEPREWSGGKLMLVGRRTVFSVETLQAWPIGIVAHEVLRQIGGYHAGNGDVKALSPGGTQLVFVGDRRVDDFYEYALTVFEFATGKAYSVPFDSNALRFESVWDATPQWLRQYFEWSRDASGAERIRLRQPVRPQPWQGRLMHSYGDVEYRLFPAGPGLYEPLCALIEAEFGAKRVAPTYGDANDPDSTSYDAGGRRFRVWRDRQRSTLSVFGEKIKGSTAEGTPALIEQIGARFNAILAAGAHQSEFVNYPAHR